MPSFFEIDVTVLEKKTFRFGQLNVFLLFTNYLPLEKDVALHLNKSPHKGLRGGGAVGKSVPPTSRRLGVRIPAGTDLSHKTT